MTDKTEPAAPKMVTLSQDELRALIAEAVGPAVTAARTEMMGDMVKVLASAKTGGEASDLSAMISELTTNIAAMTDTGHGRRVIPPAEQKRRGESAEAMGRVLMRVAADSNLHPHYKVVSQTWLDGQLIEPWVADGDTKYKPNEIIWRGAPNTALRPLNKLAHEIYDAYLGSIGGTTKDPSGVREHPVWVGNGGLQIMGQGSATAVARGLVHEPAEPATLGVGLPTTNELTVEDNGPSNPNAEKIQVLGKTFPPAERTAPGKVPNLSFPTSN